MNSKNPNGVALSDAYSANSILELTLSPNDEVVQGLVYCTDEISNSIVLKKSLNYTTLASEIRVINASCVKTKKIIAARAPDSRTDGVTGEVQEVAIALPNVTKKSIEEREKRAIMLAQESLKHINQKVRILQLNLSFIRCQPTPLGSCAFYYPKGEYGRTDCF